MPYSWSFIITVFVLPMLFSLALLAYKSGRLHLPWRWSRRSHIVRWLSEEQKKLLQQANVIYSTLVDDTVLIEARHFSRALEVLQAKMLYWVNVNSRQETVLQFKPTAEGDFKQQSVRFDSRYQPTNKRLTEELEELVSALLLSAVHRNVIIHNGNGVACPPIEDENFHIFFDASPSGEKTCLLPNTIFWIPVRFRAYERMFAPSGQGHPVWDSSSNSAVGELVGNCLYVHMKLDSQSTDVQLAVISRIFQKTCYEIAAQQVLADVLRSVTAGVEDTGSTQQQQVQLRQAINATDAQYGSEFTALVRTIILPVVKKDIFVYFMSGRSVNPSQYANDTRFCIFVHSAATNAQQTLVPSKLWDVTVPRNGTVTAYLPSGQGIPIVDCSTQFTVGELVNDNCLYLHLNLFHGSVNERLALQARVLQKVREELAFDQIAPAVLQVLPADDMTFISANHKDNRRAVFTQGFEQRRESIIGSLVQEILTPVLDTDVFVCNCFGNKQKPLFDGMFHIFFHSAPLGATCHTAPSALNGIPLTVRKMAFGPSGAGIPIIDNAGTVVAELVDQNLYILSELVAFGIKTEAAALAQLLVAIGKELAPATEAKQQLEDDQARLYHEACQHIVRECTATKQDGSAMRNAQNKLHALIVGTREAERSLYQLEFADELGREFDQLCAIDKVRNIAVSDREIIVTTDVLYCVDPRSKVRHEIGAFDIHIPTSGGSPRWLNKTRRVAGGSGNMNAPHVNSNGDACLGNTKDLFPMLISRREFASVVELAITFVESVNTNDSWGRCISNWPVANH